MPSNAENPSPPVTRRDFLTLAWKTCLSLSGLAGLWVLTKYLSYQDPPPPPAEYDLGSASDYPPDSITPVADRQAVLLNRAGEITALSLTCPHLGCRVKAMPEGFECPCHGSQFDGQGRVQRGPAASGLKPLDITTGKDGNLHLRL